jgi:hypothetical protein
MKRFLGWLKKYFIPHGKNEFKPHFLRHESMLFFLLLIIVVELGFLVQVFIVFDKTNFLAAVLPGVLTSLTNQERAQNNVSPLTPNDLLTKAAEMKARDMAVRGYFAHTSPDGKTPWYWLDQVGYKYNLAGENLAVNFFESTDVANAWMNSPSHRENIVKKGYKEIGIGVASGIYEGKNSVFVAQFFGAPFKISTSTAPVSSKTLVTSKSNPKTVAIVPINNTIPVPEVVTPAPVATQVLGEEASTPIVATAVNNNFFVQIKLFIQRVLSSPREYVTYLFGGILLLTILALMMVFFIKSEIHHPTIITRGVMLMAVIIILLFVNINVLHIETKVPLESTEASVIAY